MNYGGNLKPTKKEFDWTWWNRMFGKLKKLGTAIEMAKGPHMPIDDIDYRWVTDRIEYYESEERLLNKTDMTIANELWGKYGK